MRNNNNHSHNESEAAGFLRLAMYAGLFEVLYMCQLIDASQKVSETQDIALVTCHRDDNSNSSSGPYLLRSDSYLSCMKSPLFLVLFQLSLIIILLRNEVETLEQVQNSGGRKEAK